MALGQRPPHQGQLFFYPADLPQSATHRMLRRLKPHLDLNWLPAAVAPRFAADGRPSVDPRLIFKILVLQRLCGLRSYVETIDQCSDRLSFREFLDLDSDEPLPDPKTLGNWTRRLGPSVTRLYLDRVLEACERAGMPRSGRRVVDATFVKALASVDGPLEAVAPEQVAALVAALLAQRAPSEAAEQAAAEAAGWADEPPASDPTAGAAEPGGLEAVPAPEPAPWVPREPAPREPPAAAADGVLGPRPRPQEAVAPEPKGPKPVKVNRHDPEARLQQKGRTPAAFGYAQSVCSDPASGLIRSVIVKPLEEAGTLVEHLLREVPGTVVQVVADSLYDDGPTLAAAQALGVVTVVPAKARGKRGQYGPERFAYLPEEDAYRCPAGQLLRPAGAPVGERERQFYRASAADCGACALKRWCTSAKQRSVGREPGAEGREASVRGGPVYRAAMAERQTAEHLHLMGKRDHGLARATGVGLAALQVQADLTAVACNLRKLDRFLQAQERAAAVAALQPPGEATGRPTAGPGGRAVAPQGAEVAQRALRRPRRAPQRRGRARFSLSRRRGHL